MVAALSFCGFRCYLLGCISMRYIRLIKMMIGSERPRDLILNYHPKSPHKINLQAPPPQWSSCFLLVKWVHLLGRRRGPRLSWLRAKRFLNASSWTRTCSSSFGKHILTTWSETSNTFLDRFVSRNFFEATCSVELSLNCVFVVLALIRLPEEHSPLDLAVNHTYEASHRKSILRPAYEWFTWKHWRELVSW
jgi:hypothetical protein